MSVLLVTSLGDLVLDLHVRECPRTSYNFLALCAIKYYHHCRFHTVASNFIVQTGDPTNTGRGGSSIWGLLDDAAATATSSATRHRRFFRDEPHAALQHARKGTVSMVHAVEDRADTNASQFLITCAAHLHSLDQRGFTVFAHVAEGLDVLDRLQSYVCHEGTQRPVHHLYIRHTHILHNPFDLPPEVMRLAPPSSPRITARDPFDYEVVQEEERRAKALLAMSSDELERQQKNKEATSKAVVLEMIGDLPSADAKPPETTLFVCKLNPTTRDEDLHLIFSRFGEIRSCQVVRDPKTYASLQYAFIEFADKSACEQAYMKMDNVLIDDRRIRVDFSQSVANLWRAMRRGQPQVHGAAPVAPAPAAAAGGPAGVRGGRTLYLGGAARATLATHQPAHATRATQASTTAPTSLPSHSSSTSSFSSSSSSSCSSHRRSRSRSRDRDRDRSRSRERRRDSHSSRDSHRSSHSRRSPSRSRSRDRDRDRDRHSRRNSRSRSRERRSDRDRDHSRSKRSRSRSRSRHDHHRSSREDHDRSDRERSRR